MGSVKLAFKLGVSLAVGRELYEKYFNVFPGVKTYLDASGKRAVQDGFTTTLSGRRRYFVVPDKADREVLSHIERQGKNTPIQGTNADITKTAMALIRKRFLPYPSIKLINQVHDELVVESNNEDVPFVRDAVIEEMVAAGQRFLKLVPVYVDVVTEKFWAKG